jgi:hypothetical protein
VEPEHGGRIGDRSEANKEVMRAARHAVVGWGLKLKIGKDTRQTRVGCGYERTVSST